MEFPYEIVEFDPKTQAGLVKDFLGQKNGFVQVGEEKWCLPQEYQEHASQYYNFKSRPDDVWVITFPRSGTTLTQEIVWLLGSDLDYETAAKIPLHTRFPFLEYSMLFNEKTTKQFLKENVGNKQGLATVKELATPAYKFLETTNQKRFIKSHLPLQLLPPDLLNVGCKVIYVARSPKDVAVSFFHLQQQIRTQNYIGDFPKFWNYFQNNQIVWTPYWLHLQQAWEQRHNKNLLFLFYEDEIKDLEGTIKKIGNFLETTYSDSDYQKLRTHMQFDTFRKNDSVNMNVQKAAKILKEKGPEFIRQGKTDGWRTYFTQELNEQADKWIKENLKKTDIRFPNVP